MPGEGEVETGRHQLIGPVPSRRERLDAGKQVVSLDNIDGEVGGDGAQDDAVPGDTSHLHNRAGGNFADQGAKPGFQNYVEFSVARLQASVLDRKSVV